MDIVKKGFTKTIKMFLTKHQKMLLWHNIKHEVIVNAIIVEHGTDVALRSK